MELVKIESTELDRVVTNSGLAIQEGEEIKQSYIPFIVQLAEIQEQSKKINFENPQSIDETIARELRLKTVKIRTGASDLKDERKRIFLLKGNLEQAAFNLISASCKLTEETLNNVEKAREIAEKKRKDERKLKRIEILTALEFDFTFVDILNMPDEQFDKLVLQLENERDAKIQAAIQIEKERLEKLEAERIENERIRLENEKLQAEIKEKERLAEIERKKQAELLEAERKKQAEILAKQKAESERLAKIEAEKQSKLQAEIKAQKEAKEKLEREIQAKKDSEILAKQEAEKKAEFERLEKIRVEKLASLAPDKEKLINWLNGCTLNIGEFALKNDESKNKAIDIVNKFNSFKIWAKQQIETL
jgi:hypothetical protein